MRHLFIFLLACLWILNATAQLMVQAHAGPDTTICAGDTLTIGDTPISSNTTAPLSITWSPNVNISSTSVAHPQVWPNSTMYYYLNVTDANGRSGDDSVLVTVHSPSSASINPIPPACFLDAPVTLSQGIPSGGYYKGNGINDSITFIPLLAGAGQHTITYVLEDEVCQTSDSAKGSIEVFQNPTINHMASTDSLCIGDTAQITMTGNVNSYTWKPQYNISSVNGDSVLVWPDSSVTYIVTGSDSNSCADSNIIFIHVRDCSTGFQQITDKSDVEIYPVPFSDLLTIKSGYTDLTIDVFDLLGKLYHTETVSSESVQLNLHRLPEGLYIIEGFNKESVVFRKKILKSN